jgi:hypothetical protein
LKGSFASEEVKVSTLNHKQSHPLNPQARKFAYSGFDVSSLGETVRGFTETMLRSATKMLTLLHDWVSELSKMPSKHDHNSDEAYLQTITDQQTHL